MVSLQTIIVFLTCVSNTTCVHNITPTLKSLHVCLHYSVILISKYIACCSSCAFFRSIIYTKIAYTYSFDQTPILPHSSPFNPHSLLYFKEKSNGFSFFFMLHHSSGIIYFVLFALYPLTFLIRRKLKTYLFTQAFPI